MYEYDAPFSSQATSFNNITLKSRQFGHTTYILLDMYWCFCFIPGYTQKVITFREKTAKKLKRIVDLFHRSAVAEFAAQGLDPYKFLPYVAVNTQDGTVGTMTEMSCPAHGGFIEFATAGAKGVGRSDTLHRYYITEYSEIENAEEMKSGYAGSLVEFGARRDIDFTAKGVGNAAHDEYQAAKRGESIFRPHFFGIEDFDYSKAYLDDQRRELKRRFVQEFPRNDEEAFLQDATAIFDAAMIKACAGDAYFCDMQHDKPLDLFSYVHGCDTAEGVPDGDYAVIGGCEIESNIEAYEPIRAKMNTRQCAHRVRDVLEKYPGIIAIELNNTGHGVIAYCHNLTLRSGPFAGRYVSEFIFRQEKKRVRSSEWKTGFSTDSHSKQSIEDDFEDALAHNAITIVSKNARIEARQFRVLNNGSHGAPSGKHDDEIIQKMLANATVVRSQARAFARSRVRTQTSEHAVVTGSIMGDER